MSTLLFDPDCGLCTRAAALLRRLDLRADIEPGWREELIVHGVDLRRFERAIPFVLPTGQVAYGVVGIVLALKTSHKRWVRGTGVLLLFRPVRKVAEKIYGWVADHRGQLPGSTCSMR